MGQFSDWLRRGKNYREGENVEFYEDTHDDKGEYRKTPGFTPPQYTSAPPHTPQSSHIAASGGKVRSGMPQNSPPMANSMIPHACASRVIRAARMSFPRKTCVTDTGAEST